MSHTKEVTKVPKYLMGQCFCVKMAFPAIMDQNSEKGRDFN